MYLLNGKNYYASLMLGQRQRRRSNIKLASHLQTNNIQLHKVRHVGLIRGNTQNLPGYRESRLQCHRKYSLKRQNI